MSVPTLSSIVPTVGAQSTTVSTTTPVTLTGTFLTGATSVNVSGTGVTVSNLVVVNDTTVTALFTITSAAALTVRTVSVTTPGGTSNTETFTIELHYSQPDCRNYGNFPNSSRNVQDTLIYDVQTSSNSTVPGTDSRAAGAPVDDRVAAIIPLNSRTPGTYGPGE